MPLICWPLPTAKLPCSLACCCVPLLAVLCCAELSSISPSRRRSRSRSRSPGRGRRGDADRLVRSSRRELSPEEPSATVLLRNLPEWVADEDVFALLGEWGPLKSVRVIKDRQTGLSKGFGFVDFPSVEAAKAMMDGAKLKGGLSLGDRTLSLHYSRPLPDSVAGGASALKPMDWICSFCQVPPSRPSSSPPSSRFHCLPVPSACPPFSLANARALDDCYGPILICTAPY